MPASSSAPRSSDRLGGAWMCIAGPRIRRATATDHSISSVSHAGCAVHRRARLGQEVLDDDLLHVTVTRVRRRDRHERLDALRAGLADADEDPGRERHVGLAGRLERGEPARGRLVGRAMVRAAGLPEPCGERLEHHPLRRAHRAQRRELLAGERTGVRVRQQARLVEHRARGGDDVVDRGVVPVRGEPVGRLRVALLGCLTEGEQRLVAGMCRAVRARCAAPRRGRGTATRGAPVASRTCSSRTGRGTASSGGRRPSVRT